MAIPPWLKYNAFALFVVASIGVQAQDLTILTGHGLPKLGKSAAVWADLDGDGFQDVVLSGIGEDNQKVTAVFKNRGDGTFLNMSAGLNPVSDGAVAVGDVNRDGRLDILICGLNNANVPTTKLYLNLGMGNFSASATEFKGISQGKAALADIDNDGKPDLMLSGIDGNKKIVNYTYLQQKEGGFELVDAGLPGINQGDWWLADFNNDGYLDVLQSGLNQENFRRTDLFINTKNNKFLPTINDLPALANSMLAAEDVNRDGWLDIFLAGKTVAGKDTAVIYLNTGYNNFRFQQKLNPVSSGAAVWADINNDGTPDLIYAGYHEGNYVGYYYTNSSAASFSLSQNMAGIMNGSLQPNDFNSDGKTEVFMSGYSLPGPVAYLYRNANQSLQNSPLAPTGLQAVSKDDSVRLSWLPATDTETSSPGLSYDITIGTSPGAIDILAPLADKDTGWRKVSSRGRFTTPSALIKNLPEGTYYWKVQAIDASYQGSPFSSEGSFVICHSPVLGPDRSICYGTKLVLEQGKGTEQVNWYSKQRDQWVNNTFTYEQTITEDDTIIVEVSKSYGCSVYDTLVVQMKAAPLTLLEPLYRLCLNEEISLQAGLDGEIVNWYNANFELLPTTDRTFTQKVKEAFTVKVEVIDFAGCSTIQDIRIEPYALPQPNLGADLEACYGNKVELSLPGNYSGIQWYSGLNGALPESENLQTYTFTALKTDTLSVVVQDENGCQNADTIIVKVNELPLADAGDDKIFCLGSSLIIGGTYENTEGLEFKWEPAAFLDDPGSVNPLVTIRETTTFTLTVTNSNGCVNTDQVTVTQDAPSTIDPGLDRYICFGEETQLGGTLTATGSVFAYTYQWSPATSLDDPTAANPTAKPTETTTYELVVSTGDCRVGTASVTVEVKPLPQVTISEDVTVGLGEAVTLNASGGVGYYWYPQTALDNYNIPNPVAAPTKTTKYSVIITDAFGCQNEASLTVFVKNDLFIPNLFTPNGDGNNDLFMVYGNGVKDIVFSIYNRYGKLVFQTSDVESAMGMGWDGTAEGVQQESGLYQWSIKGSYFDGKPLQFKGNQSGTFKLIR